MRLFTLHLVLASLLLTAYGVFLLYSGVRESGKNIFFHSLIVIAFSGGISPFVFSVTRREIFIFYPFTLLTLLAISLAPGVLVGGLAMCFGSDFRVHLTDLLSLVGICLVVVFPISFAFAIRRELNRLAANA